MFAFFSVKNVSTNKREILGVSTSINNIQVKEAGVIVAGSYMNNYVPIPEPVNCPDGTDAWVYIPDEYGQVYNVPPDNNTLYDTYTTHNTGCACRLALVVHNMPISAGSYTVGSYPLVLEIGKHGIILYDRDIPTRCVEIGACKPGEGLIKFMPNTGLWSHYDDGPGNAGTMDKIPVFSYTKFTNNGYGLALVSSELSDPAWSIQNTAWTRSNDNKTPFRIWAYGEQSGLSVTSYDPENGTTRFAQTAYLTKKGMDHVREILHDIDDNKKSDVSYVVR